MLNTLPGSVFAVARTESGFKPNAILHAHGFGEETEVVFFDYSERALAIRRYLVESWDGTDFPGLVRWLESIGYRGWLVVEEESDLVWTDLAGTMAQNRKYLRSLGC